MIVDLILYIDLEASVCQQSVRRAKTCCPRHPKGCCTGCCTGILCAKAQPGPFCSTAPYIALVDTGNLLMQDYDCVAFCKARHSVRNLPSWYWFCDLMRSGKVLTDGVKRLLYFKRIAWYCGHSMVKCCSSSIA